MENKDAALLSAEIIEISKSLQEQSLNAVREKLIVLINELINKDFQALIQLLYRIDVDEKKIRLYLDQNKNEDSASVLADLVIERQLEKIKSREKYRSKNNDETGEEKW